MKKLLSQVANGAIMVTRPFLRNSRRGISTRENPNRGYNRGMKFAITRDISARISDCELTHVTRVSIDLALARRQHAAYCDILSELRWTVIRLPAAPDLPDSVFVEDTTVVTDELAILAKPGATSRLPELPAVADVLANFLPIEFVLPPATMDGGDVLVLGKDIWIGIGGRTNEPGAKQLRTYLQPHGFEIHTARTRDCLHLKSAVTRAGSNSLIVNPNWIDPRIFKGWKIIEIDPHEPFAANVLWLGDVTLTASAYQKTCARLEAHGLKCRDLDMSELAKAEGALTCCSILFES